MIENKDISFDTYIYNFIAYHIRKEKAMLTRNLMVLCCFTSVIVCLHSLPCGVH